MQCKSHLIQNANKYILQIIEYHVPCSYTVYTCATWYSEYLSHLLFTLKYKTPLYKLLKTHFRSTGESRFAYKINKHCKEYKYIFDGEDSIKMTNALYNKQDYLDISAMCLIQ